MYYFEIELNYILNFSNTFLLFAHRSFIAKQYISNQALLLTCGDVLHNMHSRMRAFVNICIIVVVCKHEPKMYLHVELECKSSICFFIHKHLEFFAHMNLKNLSFHKLCTPVDLKSQNKNNSGLS